MAATRPIDNEASGAGYSEPEALRDRVQRCFFEAGLISEIKPPIRDFTPWRNRRPVEVPGKPPSEILIEERR